jgi:hypothetical protein
MFRLIILTIYLSTYLAASSSAKVLCFHPDHGIKVETSHHSTGCLNHDSESQKNGINTSDRSCTDIPLVSHASITHVKIVIDKLISETSLNPVLYTKDFVTFLNNNTLATAYYVPLQNSRHIATTVLRI